MLPSVAAERIRGVLAFPPPAVYSLSVSGERCAASWEVPPAVQAVPQEAVKAAQEASARPLRWLL